MVEKQTALQLTAVQLSGAISLPVLLAGYFIGANYSSSVGIPVILLGNGILLMFALLYTNIGFQYQAITVELAKIFFGERGIFVSGMSLLILLVGWSVIQNHFIILSIQSLFNMTDMKYLSIVAVAIGVSSFLAIKGGLNSFAHLNRLMMPGLLVILYMTFKNSSSMTDQIIDETSLPVVLGLMMIMTTASGLVFDCPTYYRHARSKSAMCASLVQLYFFVIPLMELVGFYLAKCGIKLADTNAIGSFFQQFNAAGLIFLCISSYLSNCLNLYSATLVANHFIKASYLKSLLLISLFSAFLALIDMNDSVVIYLEVINCLAGVILAMIVIHSFFQGFNLKAISEDQRRIHEYLLYVVVGISLLVETFLPVPQYALLMTTTLIAAAVMLTYYQFRKFI